MRGRNRRDEIISPNDLPCCGSSIMRMFSNVCLTAGVVLLLSGCSVANRTTASTDNLSGTSWQLVQFVGGDDTVRKPDDPAKYTVSFAGDGTVAVRLDCNRGRGTWKSLAAGQLEVGPLALTRAMCPDPILHDQIARQWTYFRSYMLKDGHLVISLMADGGTYEFAPASRE
jgi:para-nitrobenzyl esterase